ncbi:DUF1016 N-terminal domain-containing protein [Limnobacter humi]|uniref:DUF1016 N-terminal domain-containing protein n=1 Tax=Limnobacter humi TaxID=1778671 RepID=UPI00351C2E67
MDERDDGPEEGNQLLRAPRNRVPNRWGTELGLSPNCRQLGGQERAARARQLLQRLSKDLGQRFGRGFSVENLEQMRLFYLAYPPQRISQTLSRNSHQGLFTGQSETPSRSITLEQLAQVMPLSWSHCARQLDRQVSKQFYTRGPTKSWRPNPRPCCSM